MNKVNQSENLLQAGYRAALPSLATPGPTARLSGRKTAQNAVEAPIPACRYKILKNIPTFPTKKL